MNWPEKRLGDIVTLQRGHDLPERSRKEGQVPVVSSSGITGYHSIPKAQPPGVVTGRYGTLGEVFYIEEPYWPLNTALYAVDFHQNNPRYVAYLLKQVLRRTQSDKAAVPGVNRNVLHEIMVKIPETETQGRIAEILTGYGNLIANNQRRIMLLKNTAQLLFREWFVYFRFPGHEHVKVNAGMPEGWTLETLSRRAIAIMGQSPPSKFYNQTGQGLPFHQGVKDYGDRFPNHRVFCTQLERLAQPGDILFSVRAPVGRINIARDRLVIGRGLAALRASDGHQTMLYYQLRAHFHKEDMIGTGAIYAAVTKSELFGVELLTPSISLIEEFEAIASGIDRQIEVLTVQTWKLQEARDLLLPRLMSGELEV